MEHPGPSCPTNADEAAAWLRALARRQGFAQVALAPVGPLAQHPAYLAWLQADLCGQMSYLRRDAAERRDPRALLDAAQTVLCVALSYWLPDPAPPSSAQPAPLRGRVARYAWGEDYHLVLKRRLARLAEAIAAGLGRALAYRICVDSAPLLERALGQRAGLGFQGKNTLLITPGVGSYTVLGELLLDVATTPGDPQPTRCGQCRLCLDVCPTGALLGDLQIDARRCVSYLTIELRGAIPVDLRAGLGTWVFGCDLCQEVCPWNAAVQPGDDELTPRHAAAALPELVPLLRCGAAQFRRYVKRRALRRVSRAQLLRNVAVALGNAGRAAEVPALNEALREPAALIRRHVAWALGEIAARDEAARAAVLRALNEALPGEADPAVVIELHAALQRAQGSSAELAWAVLRGRQAQEDLASDEDAGVETSEDPDAECAAVPDPAALALHPANNDDPARGALSDPVPRSLHLKVLS